MSVTDMLDVRATQPESGPMRIAVIQRIVPETSESATYWMTWRNGDGEGYAFEAGQFNMLYLFGIGEVAKADMGVDAAGLDAVGGAVEQAQPGVEDHFFSPHQA